ncbi:MAG: PA14 domain-containing protein [Terracidiphilus sp.]
MWAGRRKNHETAIHFRIPSRLLADLILVLALPLRAISQTAPPAPNQPSLSEQPTEAKASSTATPYILRLTTHEVVVELVAKDSHNHPISDLEASELQVFEVTKHAPKSPRSISAFHVINPAEAKNDLSAASSGFQVRQGGGCATSTTFHYEIAYQPSPDGWTSGYHDVLITTSRPHVTLSFRHRYYVGATTVLPSPKPPSAKEADATLREAACYHPATPPSIALEAKLVQTGDGGPVRYALVVKADSLAFISLSDEARRADEAQRAEEARRVQLDYGICTFDATGMPLKYLHTSVERVLTSLEYERALVQGLPNLLEIPESGTPVMARFVVRDRGTGNLGLIDVVRPDSHEEESSRRQAQTPPGSIRAFGSVVPSPGSFCGDVYELPDTISNLPEFWDWYPIGSLYADTLNVPAQDVTDTVGIPGVTNRAFWFGIDYHGEFWIRTPGDYQFKLYSDDGAGLFIDDQQVINLDGIHQVEKGEGRVTLDAGMHIMHVPYFQGPPTSLALVLLVRPPAGVYKVFDLRDFRPPAKTE